jgi:4-hydroxy-tetrahydrodipicolinate synthase
MIFSGVYTALATPFQDGAVDRASLARLIEHNLAGGVTGLVPVGTTGESPTLSHEEHREVIRLTIEITDQRVPVIAGTGSNCTAEAISLTQEAEKLGAQAALLVAPYYNRPTQEGLFLHYQAVASSVSIPVVLYSIPGRCGVEIAVPTVVRLAESCPNIRCLKEAGGSVERINQLRAALPEEFTLLSGDDSLTLPFLSAGARGVISVASNLVPSVMSELVASWLSGDVARAGELHQQYYPLFRDLFVESNPVPIKHALYRAGIISSPEVRLPLAPLSEPAMAQLTATLQSLSLSA